MYSERVTSEEGGAEHATAVFVKEGWWYTVPPSDSGDVILTQKARESTVKASTSYSL